MKKIRRLKFKYNIILSLILETGLETDSILYGQLHVPGYCDFLGRKKKKSKTT